MGGAILKIIAVLVFGRRPLEVAGLNRLINSHLFAGNEVAVDSTKTTTLSPSEENK